MVYEFSMMAPMLTFLFQYAILHYPKGMSARNQHARMEGIIMNRYLKIIATMLFLLTSAVCSAEEQIINLTRLVGLPANPVVETLTVAVQNRTAKSDEVVDLLQSLDGRWSGASAADNQSIIDFSARLSIFADGSVKMSCNTLGVAEALFSTKQYRRMSEGAGNIVLGVEEMFTQQIKSTNEMLEKKAQASAVHFD